MKTAATAATTFTALEARAAANIVPAPTLEQRRAQAIRDLLAR